jgi:hypothetical protein
VPWEVEYTDEFGAWWDSLTVGDWEQIRASVILLEQLGPNLGYPHSSKVNGSRRPHLRELRVQSKGHPSES